MEKTDRETHDFMNVESFSQLPFIRPTPVKERGAIRLFGKEFGGGDSDESDSAETTTASTAAPRPVLDNNQDHSRESDNNNGESSNRKFECHYCCRNFPTSQALGGHQNAHKRERQHAKRAHLQSAMVHSSFTEAQMYGIMNYHHLAAGGPPPPSLAAYHRHQRSWSNNNIISTEHNNINHGARLYAGGYGNPNYSSPNHQTVPINGSPLGLWRIPAAQNTGAAFNRERLISPVALVAGRDVELKGASRTASSVSSQNRYMLEPKSTNVQDHVSLDLHL